MSDAPIKDEPSPVEPLVTVSQKARTEVLRIRESEPNGAELALWLEVSGVDDGNYTYDMYFQPLSEAEEGDVVQEHDDLALVVPAASVDRVRGSTLDMSRDLLRGGMVLINPNSPPSASPAVGLPKAALDLSGDVEQRIVQVLEQSINPSIAAHGGRADLVAFEEGTAYLRLSGGCQGCGMAKATLSQGIEVQLVEAVPEVTSVVDVTDHASGSNPYFEAAKK